MRIVTISGLALSVAACLAPAERRCDDGLACPLDRACSPLGGCVDPRQLATCVDASDGETCRVPGVGTGTGACTGGVCVLPICGDALLEGDERCDDGNVISGDGCRGDCRSLEACGNGEVDAATEPPEQCDDGNLVAGDGCQADCQLPRCGDDVVDAFEGEVCDDGNRDDGDGCSRDCGSDETCGNDVRDPGEECDDGNIADHDGCQGHCVVQRCGDGVVDDDEACDDGNLVDTDACRATCAAATCRDGVLWVGVEVCDDGNAIDTDACRDSCVAATCGDGVTWTGIEECDDGNDVADDACDNACDLPVCGDGATEGSEECDDGNFNQADDCDNACTLRCQLTLGALPNCYALRPESLEFAAAEEECAARGGYVISLAGDPLEQTLVSNWVAAAGGVYFWVGVRWSGLDAFWSSGESANDLVTQLGANPGDCVSWPGGFGLEDCQQSLAVLCEYP